jgi:hypothetical protein
MRMASVTRTRIKRGATVAQGALLCSLALILALAGCSSSSSSSSSPPSQATSVAQIKSAYSTLFDLANPSIDPKVSVTEDGPALRSSMEHAFHSSLASLAKGATVISVKLEGQASCQRALGEKVPCALVSYQIIGSNGQPVFQQPSTGYAVYKDHRWLVAKTVVCSLMSFVYSPNIPPGC